MEEFVSAYCDLVRQIFIAGPPVVAALPGHAIAGGLIVAMAADERIAAEGKGKFGLSEVILGVSVPQCLMEPFRHVLGARQMERLAVTGENRTLEEALADRPHRPHRARGGALRARVRTGARARRPLGPGPRGDQAALPDGGARPLRCGARPRPVPRLLVLGGRPLPDPRHGRPALEPRVIPARRGPRGPRPLEGPARVRVSRGPLRALQRPGSVRERVEDRSRRRGGRRGLRSRARRRSSGPITSSAAPAGPASRASRPSTPC